MAKKIQLSYKEIEENLKPLSEVRVDPEDLGYQLLRAFGYGPAAVDRMKEGKGVMKAFDGLLIKGTFCYKATNTIRLAGLLEDLKEDDQVVKAAPKIIAVSDGETIRAYDTRERSTFEQKVDRLFCDFDFFYPLAGVERITYVEESPADIKAAEKLAKLHDEIRAYNEFTSDSDLHDLNTFMARLLFCYFAEDTGIFEKGIFTNSIRQYTLDSGSDLSDFLSETFVAMDTEEKYCLSLMAERKKRLPYVGGGLFKRRINVPRLSAKARSIILDSGALDWQNINPDIFGSMIQAVVNPEQRATQGMHYTSVPNIMKVINPLFLEELTGEYQKIYDEHKAILDQKNLNMLSENQYYKSCQPIVRKCNKLLLRMSKIKFFDPACGSGNFLIITYKKLRLLEMDILKVRNQCTPQSEIQFIDGSVISLTQFYGIEIVDFNQEIAMVSLWLAEHQMNRKFNEDFGINRRALPLKDINNIKCGNACRMDWNEVCPHTPEEEVYVFGNPPYLGSRKQGESQKLELEFLFKNDYKELDYISCWFILGSKYIKKTNSRFAFVTTNSVCQGIHVSLLWRRVLTDGLEINFAYTSFKWRNNAKNNAGVTCVIVGVCDSKNAKKKIIFSGENVKTALNISPYIIDAPTIYVKSEPRPLCKGIPMMNFGNMPADGGRLILSTEEKNNLLGKYPNSEKYIKKLIGSDEFINGKERYCIWLYNQDQSEYMKIEEFRKRIDEVREIRLQSSRPQLADTPQLFAQITQPLDKDFIIVPLVSSENRKYIPMGFYPTGIIATNLCSVVGTNDISLFGFLTSFMHMVWVKNIGGKLETRYRYSAQLCYNTFPFPKISEEKKAEIEEAATNVLLAREPYLTMGKTLADLYDPDTMPDDLKEAHEKLDDIVESCYPGYPFASDEARLECLFKLYEKMTTKK